MSTVLEDARRLLHPDAPTVVSNPEWRRIVAGLVAIIDAQAAPPSVTVPEVLQRFNLPVPAAPDKVLVSRSFLEQTPCPNKCVDGMIINTGPDPVYEPCQWCEARDIYLGKVPA